MNKVHLNVMIVVAIVFSICIINYNLYSLEKRISKLEIIAYDYIKDKQQRP